jgi:DNA-binding IclR family transcriptional regulator/AraC-like DNA-binding protein
MSLQSLKGIARARLQAVREEMPVTFGLSVLDGRRLKNRILLSFPGPDYTCFRFPDGTRTPLHTSAPGKALVAFAAERERERIIGSLGYERLTPRTIRNADEYRRCLKEVSRRGYAVDMEEELAGCRCGGVPILDGEGRAVAAVFFSGVAGFLTEKVILEKVQVLRRVAAEIEGDISRLSQGGAPRGKKMSPFTREIIARMRASLSNPPPLRFLTDARGASYSTLRAAFKADTGLPMGRYFLTMRLREAARLLRAADMPVTDVCARLGFCNAKYFSAQFRRHFGLSPGAYRGKRGKPGTRG